MIRNAQYAGSFYSNREKSLIESIEQSFTCQLGPGSLPSGISKPVSIIPYFVVPHAGYVYSGPVAAWSYLELSKYEPPETVIILGPNHTGLGAEIGVPNKAESWRTPLGDVPVNHNLIDALMEETNLIKRSDDSHAREHSIEVQLPFLQYILKDKFNFIPITLLNQGYDASVLLGEIIAKVCEGRNVVVIASSDLSHFESHDRASEKDGLILEAVEAMDIKKMYDIKFQQNVSMCGYGPIAGTIKASKETGRNSGQILKYATSGDAMGDKRQVVGYASAAFYSD